jgi:hypothetical protein
VIVWGKANLAKYLPAMSSISPGGRCWGSAMAGPQPRIAAATLLELALQ